MASKTADMLTSEEGADGSKPGGTMISIWFFVGCLLTIYGVLILLAYVFEGSGEDVVMSHLHTQIWWGIGLLVIGLAYVAAFRPRNVIGSRRKKCAESHSEKDT